MPLIVAVRLRHGRYDAGTVRPSVAEWPPHPARVFCALVASAQTEQEWEALRWLERAGDPEVWDSGPAVSGRSRAYVVTNKTEGEGKSQFWPGRSNELRSRSYAVPSAEAFMIAWPEADPGDELVRRLRGLAARVPYVGRSTSQAEVTVYTDPPGDAMERTFRRSAFGRPDVVELRVPYPGYIDALREADADGRRAWEVSLSVAYAAAHGEEDASMEAMEESAAPITSPYGDVIVWGLEKPTARIDGGRAAHLTGVLRKAVLDRVCDPVPPQVSGHGADGRPHVAFLAIPDVGHRHADGHLLGLGMAVPRDMPADDWQRLVQGVAVDPLSRLKMWRTEEPLRLAYGSDLRGLRPERWTAREVGGARVWTTATPMMTDGRLRKGRSMAELVRKSLLYAGYPEPAGIETSRAPLIPGAVRRPRAETLPAGRPQRPIIHARVMFDQPVIGPVIAGSLRYLGLGLFLPDQQSNRRTNGHRDA